MSHSFRRWLLVIFWLSILVFGVSAEPTQASTFWGSLSNDQLVQTMLIASAALFGISGAATLLHRIITQN